MEVVFLNINLIGCMTIMNSVIHMPIRLHRILTSLPIRHMIVLKFWNFWKSFLENSTLLKMEPDTLPQLIEIITFHDKNGENSVVIVRKLKRLLLKVSVYLRNATITRHRSLSFPPFLLIVEKTSISSNTVVISINLFRTRIATFT